MYPNPSIPVQQVLILDTGPLWELILYASIRDLRFGRLRSDLRYLHADTHYDAFTAFIAKFSRRITTPHVVSEIGSKVIKTRPSEGQAPIWGIVHEEFRAMRMDETLFKLLEMPLPLVAKVGATDASIVELGLNYGRTKSLVVSVDSALIAECKRAGLDAKDIWEILAA